MAESRGDHCELPCGPVEGGKQDLQDRIGRKRDERDIKKAEREAEDERRMPPMPWITPHGPLPKQNWPSSTR